MGKFADIDIVRQVLKDAMPLDILISTADAKFTADTGIRLDPLERVHDDLYKKRCDLDSHPMDKDGSRDSTASFTVCPPKELWHCFGCGSSGDRFEYISQKFNVEHIESIHMVAQLEGIDLTQYYADISPEEMVKESLFRENESARNIAHTSLLNNQSALDYLHGRGITDESIELFNLGYAPPLQDNRVAMFDSVINSMALQLDRKDQFNHAILFPITDVMGRMRYFQSRPFKPLSGMKYLGGNDTHPLYDETDRIFGFNISRRMIHKNGGKLVGVEGAPDTIACIQVGIPTAGFLGTVVNQATFNLLDRYRVTELILLLDGDTAGRDRSYKIAEKYLTIQTKVRLRIAVLPDGYDPDDYINKFGSESLERIIDESVYAIQYLIDSKWNDARTPTDKMAFIYNVRPYMVMVNDKVIRNIMVNDIANKMGMDPYQVDDYYTQAMVDTTGAKLYSPDGEEIILGEALRNQGFISDLTLRFSDDDWYLLRHKYLFRILKNAQYTDVESLSTIAKNMNLDQVVTPKWLEYLYGKHGNVEFSISDVEDKLMRRRTLQTLSTATILANDMSHDITVALDRTASDMYSIMHKRADENIYDGRQQASRAMKLIHERMKNPSQIIGHSLGDNFAKTTQALLGLQRKTLTIVSANQSVGKTQICENWALAQSVGMGVPVLWFTLEMDVDLMTFRHLSILSGVPCTPLMTGNITLEQKKVVDDASIKLENAPLYISEHGNDLSESLAIARRYVMRYGVCIVYVDYIQLQYVSEHRNEARHRELGMMSKAWKQFCKDMDCHVVCISQLSKEALHAVTAEAEHGAGSYEIAQDADNYITLKEKSEEEINQRGIEHGNITENISKNRMGEKSILIDLYADRAVHRMMEV